SGNTLYWRVSLDHERGIVEGRKTSLPEEGEIWGAMWLSRAEWRERWHAYDGEPGGLWELVGGPTEELLGVTAQGIIAEGSPASFAPYEVVATDHVLLRSPEPVELVDGRYLGVACLNGTAASGFEIDATPWVDGAQLPLPEGLTLIAAAR